MHAELDELEWIREDARLNAEERDRAVTDLIDLVVGFDGILQAQARADAAYFISINDRASMPRRSRPSGTPLSRRIDGSTSCRA